MIEGLLGVDPHGNISFCSETLFGMIGYRADELVGKSIHDLLRESHPHETERPAPPLWTAMNSRQQSHAVRGCLSRKDGTKLLVECRLHPVAPASTPAVSVIRVQDVSEREATTAALRKREAKLRRILASMADVAWTSDQYGRMIYVSPKIEAILGYTKQEICSGNSLRSALIHPQDFGRVNQSYRALFSEQTVFDEEYRIQRKDGSWIWVHDRATSIYPENGTFYADGLLGDITVRKQAEADLIWKTAFLEAQIDSTLDGILVVDGYGRKLLNNRRLVELFNVPDEVLADKDGRRTLEYIISLLKNPVTAWATVKHLLSSPDDTSRDEIELKRGMLVDRYSAPVISRDGKYYGRIWTFRDITDRKRDEDMLRQLSMAVEQSPVSVVITDPTGAISYVNPKFTDVTGYTTKEVLGKSLGIVKSGLTAPETYQHLWSTIGQRQEWRGEFCNKKKNGELYWEAAKIRPIIDAKGEIAHYLAVKEDITERKRAEEELCTSRQLLQSILDAIPQRVFWKDRNCIYLGCNRSFAIDAGLNSPAEIVGKSDFELSWRMVAELYRADDQQVMERRSAKLNFQERQTRPDGSLLWLQTSKLPLVDPDDKVTGVVGIYEDITDRRQAEWELRLTKASLDIASDSILWIDRKARIVYANYAACTSLGRSREELVSLSVADIDPLFPAADWEARWEEKRKRPSATFESQHRSKDGRVFPVEVTTNYIEFDGQEYSFAFVRDITERRSLETQLRQAQKLEAIGQLAAGIAHEINTPTQFVADNLSFLRDSWKGTHELLELYRTAIRNTGGALSAELGAAERSCDLDFILAEVPHAIDQALDGTTRVAKIVGATKEFSHPDASDKSESDLNRAIESTITVARNEWKYVAEVATDLDPALAPILCYPGDINQVVLNLLVNAAHAIREKVKDGEKGLITVRTRSRGKIAEISVTDTGNGIPEAIRTRVFDPFFTTKEVGKGTGQGLSLAHTVVVKKHSGRIWFETENGRGTTFFVELPIMSSQAVEKT